MSLKQIVTNKTFAMLIRQLSIYCKMLKTLGITADTDKTNTVVSVTLSHIKLPK